MSLSSLAIVSLLTLVFAIGVLSLLLRFSKLLPTFSKGLKCYSLLGIAAFLTLFAHSANLIEVSIYERNVSWTELGQGSVISAQHLSISKENKDAGPKSDVLFLEKNEEDNLLSLRKLLQKNCSIIHTVFAQSGYVHYHPDRTVAHLDPHQEIFGADRYLSFIQVYRI